MSKHEYTRLAYGRRSRKNGFFGMPGTRSALWLGTDHILLVRGSLGAEEYRRFYFKDIQAIIVRNTRRRSYLNCSFIGLALLVLAIILLSSTGVASFVAIGISIGVFGVPILVNSLLGPCCEVQIRTAVQIEDLAALSRLSRAKRVLDRVRPRIQAAQGSLTAEEIVERLRAFERYPASRKPAPTSPLGLTGNESL